MSYETIYKYDQRTVNARDAAKALNAYCGGLAPQGMTVQDIQQYRLENNDDLLLLYYVAEYYNTASGNPASFSDGADDVPVKELTVAIDTVQQGSGTPSVENPRLFTPTTSATIRHTGKNLWADGDVTVNATTGYTSYAQLGTPIPAGTYTVSALVASEAPGTQAKIEFSTSIYYTGVIATAYLQLGRTDRQNATITIPSQANYVRFFSGQTVSASSGYGAEYTDIQFEAGSTATDYETYTAKTPLNISFGTAAGDVYGGTLNVTTGELTVTHRFVEFVGGNETWEIAWSDSNPAFYNIIADAPIADSTDRGLFSLFVKDNIWSGGGNNCAEIENLPNQTRIYVRYDNMPETTTLWKQQLADWKTAGIPLQTVFRLSEPQIIQLTPTEVKTFLGGNNISADTGDVEVTYRAVPDLG